MDYIIMNKIIILVFVICIIMICLILMINSISNNDGKESFDSSSKSKLDDKEKNKSSSSAENDASSNQISYDSFDAKTTDIEFDIKVSKLRDEINRFRLKESNSYTICIHRESILEDSIQQITSVKSSVLKQKKLKVTFWYERGIDNETISKEWLALVAEESFNPDKGYFAFSSEKNNTIRPSFTSYVDEDLLEFFRFIGRILGISIMYNYNICANFDRSVYKYIMNEKLRIRDLEEIDPECCKSLTLIKNNSIDGNLQNTFSYETYVSGKVKIVELIENGREIFVTDENKQQYLDLMVKSKLVKNIEQQLDAIKTGLFELIDLNLLSAFTGLELELLICGY